MFNVATIRQKVNKLVETGFFHIFLSEVVNKIIAFLSGTIIIRILSKTEYGVVAYTNNILSFFLMFSGLGTASAILQLCSENIEQHKKEEIYFYSTTVGLLFNIFISVALLIASFTIPLKFEGANLLLGIMSISPLIGVIFQYQSVYLRYNLRNKQFALNNNINTFLVFVFSVVGALIFKTVGYLLFSYVATLVTIIIAIRFFRTPIKIVRVMIDKQTKIFLYKVSIISCVTNGLNSILYIADIFIIGIIISNESIIASYKVATVIPLALYFIPTAVVVYIYPYFAKNKDNKYWVLKNYGRLLLIMGVINGIISTIMIFFAPLIIRIVFGAQYLDAVIPFRILMLNYFFGGTFMKTSGNLMFTQRKVIINFINSIVCGTVNIVANIFFIQRIGSSGAAITTLLATMLSGTILTLCFYRVVKKI